MKKEYVKPTLCIEYYMLSETIAACNVPMNTDGGVACDFYADQGDTTNCSSSSFEQSLRPIYTEMAPSWGPETACTCYNGPVGNPEVDYFAS